MRLWKTFALAALPLAATFGAVTSAHAAGSPAQQCLPGNYDAARGIKGGDCYTTSEMKKILQAYNQTILVSGDRITVSDNASGPIQTGKNLNVFTSSPDGRMGLNLEGDKPGGQVSSTFGIRAVMSDIRIWDRTLPITASADIIGPSALEVTKRSGDHLMLSAKCGPGVYCGVYVTGNQQDVGSFTADNGKRGGTLAVLSNLAYSPTGVEYAKRQTSEKLSQNPK